jgi:hypothetical protein
MQVLDVSDCSGHGESRDAEAQEKNQQLIAKAPFANGLHSLFLDCLTASNRPVAC